MEPSVAQLILPIKIEKSPEGLTSLRGLVVLEELARGMGLGEEVDRAWEGPESGRGYKPREFVQPRVGMRPAGGRRLEDLRELRAEHAVLKERGLESVPDAGTVGDWLRRQGEAGAEARKQVNQEVIAPCREAEGEELILDVDATEIAAEKQEAAGTYNHVQGYLPRVGYVNGVCVGRNFGKASRARAPGF